MTVKTGTIHLLTLVFERAPQETAAETAVCRTVPFARHRTADMMWLLGGVMKMFSYKITIPCSSLVCLLVFPPSPCAKVRHKPVWL